MKYESMSDVGHSQPLYCTKIMKWKAPGDINKMLLFTEQFMLAAIHSMESMLLSFSVPAKWDQSVQHHAYNIYLTIEKTFIVLASVSAMFYCAKKYILPKYSSIFFHWIMPHCKKCVCLTSDSLTTNILMKALHVVFLQFRCKIH